MSATASPVQTASREARAPVRILCVEDNDGDFGLVRAHLKRAAFSDPIEVHRAQTMAETVRLFTGNGALDPYDIVLLDLSLPDSHGPETYQQLRAVAPRIAVAILSGNSDEALALELVQLGAQDYLPKASLTTDLLMRCVIYAMNRQRHRVEMEELTDRLRRTGEELKTTQMQLIQVEKIESLGRLASSVAHEVKNPLGVIQMGIDFLHAQLPAPSSEIQCTLTLMEDAVTRADAIIHDMLDFSRSEAMRMKSCDVNDIVHCVERTLKHEFDRRKITLVEELGSPMAPTQCDANGIEQVLINVAMNSLQAMTKGGVLTVRTRLARAEEAPRDQGLREMTVLRAGDPVVVIEVQDQGPGIPEEMMSRVFEPFFTTKPTGEGTGLGLSVCRRIVELHRGQFRLANIAEPRGLLVSIILKAEPIGDRESETHAQPPRPVAAAPTTQTA